MREKEIYNSRVGSKRNWLFHPERSVFYFRVEQPGLRFVSISRSEFQDIMHRLGYLLNEIKGWLVLQGKVKR